MGLEELCRRLNLLKWSKEGEMQCCQTQACAPNAVKSNKPKRLSLEQRKFYCKGQARRMGGSCSKDPYSLMVFREEFEVRTAECMTFF